MRLNKETKPNQSFNHLSARSLIFSSITMNHNQYN